MLRRPFLAGGGECGGGGGGGERGGGGTGGGGGGGDGESGGGGDSLPGGVGGGGDWKTGGGADGGGVRAACWRAATAACSDATAAVRRRLTASTFSDAWVRTKSGVERRL